MVPLERLALILGLILFAALPSFAGSMFDLPPGAFACQEDAHHSLTLTIGPPETRAFTLAYSERSKDSSTVTVTGTYKVTATKGDYHVKWTITDVTRTGYGRNDIKKAEILGATLAPGQAVSLILDYKMTDGVTLTLFDPELQPVFTRTLLPR